MPELKPFELKQLGKGVDGTAPDGTALRLLLTLAGGSLAHFELPAGAASHAVAHRTIEEIWFVVEGGGGDLAPSGRRGADRSACARDGADHSARNRVPVSRRRRSTACVRGDHHAALAGHARGRPR